MAKNWPRIDQKDGVYSAVIGLEPTVENKSRTYTLAARVNSRTSKSLKVTAAYANSATLEFIFKMELAVRFELTMCFRNWITNPVPSTTRGTPASGRSLVGQACILNPFLQCFRRSVELNSHSFVNLCNTHVLFVLCRSDFSSLSPS